MVEKTSVVSGKFVVTVCYAPEVFDLTKEAFDQIAVSMNDDVKAALCGGCGSARHNWFCASSCNGIHRPLFVIAFVSQNMSTFWPVEQRLNLCNVVAFVTSQDEADKVAKSKGSGVNLGAQATPFFNGAGSFDRPSA